METSRIITTIDAHTAGENVRFIISGVPPIPGETMSEKMKFFMDKMGDIRTSVMQEPRGYAAMFGCVVTPPTRKDADLGILFLSAPGYLDMCGHVIIGATTIVTKTGMVERIDPQTTVRWDTVTGVVQAVANVEKGRTKSVTFKNVPSFLYKSDVEIDLPGKDKIYLDISFGGIFTAIVDAKQLGIELTPTYSSRILDLGTELINAVNEQIVVDHPIEKKMNKVVQIMFTEDPSSSKANYKNTVVCCHGKPGSKKAIDRSPCGTGTCARMAQLYAKGKLELDQTFIHESITGTMFKGTLLEEVALGDLRAVIPEITGSAYITGMHQFVFDPDDPLKDGFLL